MGDFAIEILAPHRRAATEVLHTRSTRQNHTFAREVVSIASRLVHPYRPLAALHFETTNTQSPHP